MNVINKDVWVHLEDNRGDQRIVKLQEGKKINWRKTKFDIGGLIGKEYYTFYRLEQGGIQQTTSDVFLSPVEQSGDVEITKTNKDLFDRNESQKLTQEEILELKQVNTGEDVIKQIVANSETFASKTEYSQAKYLRKKNQKYVFCFVVKPCTLENIHKTFYADCPAKINYMRQDTLAIFMQLAGINEESNVILFDNTFGLTLAAVAQRLCKIHLVTPNKTNLKNFLPFVSLNLPSTDHIQFIDHYDQLSSYSHILISGEFNIKEIFEHVHDKLQLGGVIVVFSSFLEKLSELSELLIGSHEFSFVQIYDSFLRNYQVLENRTHPMVNMDAFGGYLLQSYRIQQ